MGQWKAVDIWRDFSLVARCVADALSVDQVELGEGNIGAAQRPVSQGHPPSRGPP